MKTPLKFFIFLFTTFTLLGFAACASLGTTTAGTDPSVAPGDGSDFSGQYILRAQNCEPFDGIIVFTVTQNGTDLTITVDEVTGDDFFPGDQILGTVVSAGSTFVANISELQCIAALILDQAGVDDANSRISGGVAQIGDLDAFCQDDSADGTCTVIYQHASF